jgi:2-polyprenyl-6-methoxyphenol hydroxylase-like FAD-dependent oxidoreductase
MRQGAYSNVTVVFHSDRFEEGWDTYGDPEELRERVANLDPKVRDFVMAIQDWRMYVLRDRDPIRDWSKGRVTLLGDAAHPMLQYLAQGACMAMEDAVCLADQVASHASDPAAAFKAYQQHACSLQPVCMAMFITPLAPVLICETNFCAPKHPLRSLKAWPGFTNSPKTEGV